jgi:superfamily II DNA or RNA helicase|tara:strand:+ start:1876 stop:3348 length:1473 start_codon:yes stop_codon:yes gene_type:complete
MDDDDIATYIGWKGYTIYKKNISVQEQQMLRKELNVKPFVPKSSLSKPQPFPVYRESKNKIYVPIFYGMEVYGEPDEIRIDDGKKINVSFKGELRPKQKPVVKKFMKHIKKKNSGLLALHTGFGKTCLALNIISKIKLKTIIIVHKEFLLRQWVERIEQFLPDAKVGKIQAKTIDTEGKDIVICMLQSLSMKEYPKDMFREYGFSIYDEVHHLGAEVFSKAFYKVVTKYSLGLSATINRKDGLTKVIKWFLGDVVCKLERKGEDNVLVKVINYETTDEDFNKIETDWRGQIKYTTMVKKLCEFNNRSEFILKVLSDLLKGNPNQQIMILAHQKKLLQYLHDAIRHRTIATVGYYVGGMKEKDLKISEGKKVIIATYAMAEEGLDIKSLTTLIMATPKVDVRQSVGRILRQKHNEAVVVDIVDSHSLFQRHFTKRKTFYRKSKFKVIQTNMNGYQNGDWETIYDPINKIKKAFSKTKNEDKLLQGVCLIGN